jgi:hypothetical protein
MPVQTLYLPRPPPVDLPSADELEPVMLPRGAFSAKELDRFIRLRRAGMSATRTAGTPTGGQMADVFTVLGQDQEEVK